MTLEQCLARLRAKARPRQLTGMARYGISIKNRLGVAVPDLRAIAKEAKKSHALALALWKTGIADARILAGMVDEPAMVTPSQMDSWARDFNSWDLCDQVCMNLFDKTPHAWKRVVKWARQEEEFVRRAAFALIACLAWHDKTAEDKQFITLFPLIKKAASDDRNMVKKAVSWALRHVGKRNRNLHALAIKTAKEIRKMDSRSARWIGADAVRDLASPATLRRVGSKESKRLPKVSVYYEEQTKP
jgi:3-methyladenine DNA glycosylase AlkD